MYPSIGLLLLCCNSAIASSAPIRLEVFKAYPAHFQKRDANGYLQVQLDPDANRLRYRTDLTIGTPGQKFSMLVDTGSSDTWVPDFSAASCKSNGCTHGSFDSSKSSSFHRLTEGGQSFNISYDGAGSTVSGYYFNDILTLTDSVSTKNMTIGLATEALKQQNSGILGLGRTERTIYLSTGGKMSVPEVPCPDCYRPLRIASAEPRPRTPVASIGRWVCTRVHSPTLGFASNEASLFTIGEEVPTLVDELLQQGIVDRKAYSLFMSSINSDSGSILFGAIDESKYTGPLISFPVQRNPQGGARNSLNVDLTSISVKDGSGTRLLSNNLAASTVLDTGNPGLVLPNNVFTAILNGVGATYLGPGYIPAVPYSVAESEAAIVFGLEENSSSEGLKIEVPFSELISRFLYYPGSAYPNGEPICEIYMVLTANDLVGALSLGDTFLRAAYVVYDLANSQIALAQATRNPGAEKIVRIPSGTGLPGVSSTAVATASTSLASYALNLKTVNPTESFLPATPTFNLVAATSTSGSASATSNAGGSLGAEKVTIPAGLGFLTLMGLVL